MREKLVILFVEGDTDDEFYKSLVSSLRNKANEKKFSCEVIVKNVKGVGRYKDKVKRIFINQIKPKYPNFDYHVFLCYDTDAFQLQKNPPIDWSSVKKALGESGATVYFIEAHQSIEDWFLIDMEGVLKFLRLPIDLKCKGKNGQVIIEKLFKKANKLYVKGCSTKGFIGALDIDKIMMNICSELNPLCKQIGIRCNNQNYCKGKST